MTPELAKQRGVEDVGESWSTPSIRGSRGAGPSAPYILQSGPTMRNGFGNTVWIISILLPKKRSLATP
jgi:hypothetical protein